MRLPGVRPKVWWLMVAVAAVAVVLGAAEMRRRHVLRVGRAEYHARWERLYRVNARMAQERLDHPPDALNAELAKRHPPWSRWGDWHARMRRKWEDAARRPWTAVAPDPPEPPSSMLPPYAR